MKAGRQNYSTSPGPRDAPAPSVPPVEACTCRTTSEPSWRRTVIAGALSGTLYLLAMPAEVSGLFVFVALVPWLRLVRHTECAGRAALATGAMGLFLFIPGLVWVRYVTIFGWLVLSVVCAGLFVPMGLAAWLARHRPLWVFAGVTGSAWIVQEWARSSILSGFPWYLLGHGVHGLPILMQAADLAGVSGLSLALVILSCLVEDILSRLGARQYARGTWVRIAAAIAFCACWTLYGAWRLHTVRPGPLGFRAAMVQGSIPQSLKESVNEHYNPRFILDRYARLTENLAAEEKARPPSSEPLDLVLWPETVVIGPFLLTVNPDILRDDYAKDARYAQETVAALAREVGAPMLIGTTSRTLCPPLYVETPEEVRRATLSGRNVYFNSALLISPRGDILDRYDKIHIVPFGEYVPFERILPFLRALVPSSVDVWRGTRLTVFRLPPRHGIERGPTSFCVTICYEDTDAALVRRMARQGIDFLVNISNDAWFNESLELEQHLAAAQFRAIENRICVVRSGNNGISCIVDPVGRTGSVLEREIGGRIVRKGLLGSVSGPVQARGPRTLYSLIGNIVPPLCTIFLAVWAGRSWRTRRRAAGRRDERPVRAS